MTLNCVTGYKNSVYRFLQYTLFSSQSCLSALAISRYKYFLITAKLRVSGLLLFASASYFISSPDVLSRKDESRESLSSIYKLLP